MWLSHRCFIRLLFQIVFDRQYVALHGWNPFSCGLETHSDSGCLALTRYGGWSPNFVSQIVGYIYIFSIEFSFSWNRTWSFQTYSHLSDDFWQRHITPGALSSLAKKVKPQRSGLLHGRLSGFFLQWFGCDSSMAISGTDLLEVPTIEQRPSGFDFWEDVAPKYGQKYGTSILGSWNSHWYVGVSINGVSKMDGL